VDYVDTISNPGTSVISDASIIEALDLFGNAEEVDVNILIDMGGSSDAVKRYMVTDICEIRKDCMALINCPSNLVINAIGQETENLREYRRDTLNMNTSYAALYGNWLEVYDKWNGKYRWCPASGFVAGVYANTDNTTDPWFAPAGLNRAILNSVRKLAWNPTLGQRDILYKNGINPIVSFAGQGKVIWGQKTQLDKESAFNRVNVRRLFIVLEKAISTAAKYFLFEPNDDLTRLLLVNMIDPFLRDVKSRRGIYDFMIVCDGRNNTPERIDRNELWCDIYIKPTRAAEFIVLNFIATKTGASFTELAGAMNG
jgi:phage tail sheath protein FI